MKWFRWECNGFCHAINLDHVSQWLYHPSPNEHAFAWLIGQGEDHLTFEGDDAGRFCSAMETRIARIGDLP